VGRDPNMGRETVHSGSRNNLHLNLQFSIDRVNTIIYCFILLSFTQFSARKLLLSIVVLKLVCNYEVFSAKHGHEMLESREFRTVF